MKKIKYFITLIITFVVFSIGVKAAPSYSFNVSQRSVENGKSVTASVTIRNTAAWNISITSSGNTYGCSNSWADSTDNANNVTKTFSTTCKANSLGTIAFTLSGNITSSDEQKLSVSGTERVNVVEPRKASTNNALKALGVEGISISPEFDSEVLDYTASVGSETNKITINATKADSYAKVDGAGEKEVEEGPNKFEIVVTAENGSQRTYNLTVTVEDKNPIKAVDDLTIVKNPKNLEIPEGFAMEKQEIDGIEVPVFKNNDLDITLVALKDNSGNIYFYQYKDNKYTKYMEVNSNLRLLLKNVETSPYKGFSVVTKKINDTDLKVLQYKTQDKYVIVYAMNLSNAKDDYYLYDVNNNTYQIFNEELFNTLISDSSFYITFVFASIGVIVLCIIIIILLIVLKNKNKSNPKVKTKKEEKKEKTILDE